MKVLGIRFVTLGGEQPKGGDMNGTVASETSPLDKFVRKYGDRKYCHTALVRHKGPRTSMP